MATLDTRRGIAAELLAAPRPDMTLAELAQALNALAHLRHNARLSFCRHLSVVYLMIVGHGPVHRGRPTERTKEFYQWCADNLVTATGKIYSRGTLSKYVMYGFAKNGAELIRLETAAARKRAELVRLLGQGIAHAVKGDKPHKRVVSIETLRRRMPGDVATEVNQLMRAWESASTEARAQFIYHVTGQRLRAA